jgi:hypothetical protein
VTVDDASSWKRCSTCKKPIAFASGYFTCNVSTCNRKGTDFAFCSVACWDGHVPVLRHREAWAEEQRAPTAETWAAQQRAQAERAATPAVARPAPAPDRPGPASSAGTASRGEPMPHDILIVVSKLKAYIKARAGMNCSDGLVDVLSDHVRALADQAVEHARVAGRKTVLDRDLDRPR